MQLIKGKQIDDNTITQANISITTQDVINPTDLTTKEWVENYVNTASALITYCTSNLNMTALVTVKNTGYNLACSTPVQVTPNSDIKVLINGVEVNVGLQGTNVDCNFSPDGVTFRAIGDVRVGDFLYWDTTNARYQLDSNDEIDFIYLIYN